MATIFVIDDEPAVRQVVHDILTDEGHHVISAIHGEDALAQLKTVVVDLILCDVMMPTMAGDVLAATLHADPRYTTIPLIMMSAALDRTRLPVGTYTAVLEKPWTIPQLLTTIATALVPNHTANAPVVPPTPEPPFGAPDGPICAA
jgi:CheY-like chemotaxis protein